MPITQYFVFTSAYLWDMKSYSISIDNEAVLRDVYRLTANAAVQRGDALHVATLDNVDLLTQFMNEGRCMLDGAMGHYSRGNLEYLMPMNWPDMRGEIDALAKVFLVNYIIAKWYELNGTGERFLATANDALQGIAPILNKRNKPI